MWDGGGRILVSLVRIISKLWIDEANGYLMLPNCMEEVNTLLAPSLANNNITHTTPIKPHNHPPKAFVSRTHPSSAGFSLAYLLRSKAKV